MGLPRQHPPLKRCSAANSTRATGGVVRALQPGEEPPLHPAHAVSLHCLAAVPSPISWSETEAGLIRDQPWPAFCSLDDRIPDLTWSEVSGLLVSLGCKKRSQTAGVDSQRTVCSRRFCIEFRSPGNAIADPRGPAPAIHCRAQRRHAKRLPLHVFHVTGGQDAEIA